jgi:hypothetical protein
VSTDQSDLSILLSSALLSQLEAFQRKTGISSRSAAVIAILEQYFETADLEPAPLAQPDGVLKRLEALEKHVLDLNKQIVQLQRTVSFMPGSAIALTLEQTATDTLTDRLHMPEQPGIAEAIEDLAGSIGDEDEDLEDEPDEILYDFLEPESDS